METLFAFNELDIDAAVLIDTAMSFKLKEDHLAKLSLEYQKDAAEQRRVDEKAEEQRDKERRARDAKLAKADKEAKVRFLFILLFFYYFCSFLSTFSSTFLSILFV